jgi:hypothetical protein
MRPVNSIEVAPVEFEGSPIPSDVLAGTATATGVQSRVTTAASCAAMAFGSPLSNLCAHIHTYTHTHIHTMQGRTNTHVKKKTKQKSRGQHVRPMKWECMQYHTANERCRSTTVRVALICYCDPTCARGKSGPAKKINEKQHVRQ